MNVHIGRAPTRFATLVLALAATLLMRMLGGRYTRLPATLALADQGRPREPGDLE
jgi:hypothetical protein